MKFEKVPGDQIATDRNQHTPAKTSQFKYPCADANIHNIQGKFLVPKQKNTKCEVNVTCVTISNAPHSVLELVASKTDPEVVVRMSNQTACATRQNNAVGVTITLKSQKTNNKIKIKK